MMLRQMINETERNPEGVQSHALCKAMPSYSRDRTGLMQVISCVRDLILDT